MSEKQEQASNKPAKEDKPAPAQEQTTTAAKAGSVAKKKGSRAPVRFNLRAGPTVLTLAVVIALGSSAISFYLWQQHRIAEQDRLALSASIEKLLQVVEQRSKQQNANVEQLSQHHQLLKHEMASLEQRIPDLRQQLLSRQRDWELAEVDYLLRLAGHRLQFSHDVPSSVAALTLANDLLTRHGAENFAPVILQIRANIDKLEQFSRSGSNHALSQLNTLIISLEGLPLVTVNASTQGAETASAENGSGGLSVTLGYWGRKIWSDIKSLVVIRRGDEIRHPLTSENQRFFVQAQLQLKLEAARLAASQHDQLLFSTNVEEADALLARYFLRDNREVEAARNSLKELASHSVALPLSSFAALREQLYQQLQGDSAADSSSDRTQDKVQTEKGAAATTTEGAQ